ncbi:2-oxoglutarate dehydrogenase E1 component [Coemansia aciculifera]|nr:2-oxoglutarate dehydrogenase E1 component [Coemansia aciculifera]
MRGGGRSTKDRKRSQPPGRYLKRNHQYSGTDSDFAELDRSLKRTAGLYCKDIAGDGNCLFRALADQLDGTPDTHVRHREVTCDYMASHPEEFAPFLDETCSFDRYLDNMRHLGVFAGNLELVAFARNYRLDIRVYQAGGTVFVISGGESPPTATVHIAYHSYEHYSSPVVSGLDIDDEQDDVGEEEDPETPTDTEKIVMASTAVENHQLVRRLLQTRNADAVIELLIQWMATTTINSDDNDDDIPWWAKDGPPTYDGPPLPQETDTPGTVAPPPAAAETPPADTTPAANPPLHKKGAARQKKALSKKRQKEMSKLKKKTAARQFHHQAKEEKQEGEESDKASLATNMSHIYI